MPLEQFVPFIPEIFLAIASFVLLVGGIGLGRRGMRPLALGAVGSLVVTGILVWLFGRPAGEPEVILGGMLAIDTFAVFFKLLVLASAILTIMLATGFLERFRYGGGEFFALILTATLGMFVMASGVNLVSLYVGLELMALSSYVLVGYCKLEVKSNEGAVKYFVLGAMSSGILLYGISLVYGSLGTLDLMEIKTALVAAPQDNLVLMLGIVLMAFGMLFKVAAVPFHVWSPDAYEGAPTPVTAFISVAPKAAAFAMFLRIFAGAFSPEIDHWRSVIWLAAAMTMIFGNIAALSQDNVKRMLAYSSIAHAGYALMGVVAGTAYGTWSVLMYMLVYTFMNIGAFGLVVLLETRGYAGETVKDWAGLSKKAPAAAAGMLILLLALAGIPPTGGFMSKLYVFAAAINAGYIWLAVIGVLMSAVSLYYYFRIVVQMYLVEGEEAESGAELVRDRWAEGVVLVSVLVVMAIGVYPAPFVGWAQGGLNALGLM
ncbi:MAG: NADH-quinone oxidoreductase subunit N [Thermoanaerobaculales bacterium]|nr:NADH-quinone oxidoreductase subunit N [Thermoanaerobaculales bacterium]